MEDRGYFASLTRAENARCSRHRAHGYGSAFGVGCMDCYAAQAEALRFQRAQRAQADQSVDLFALAEDRVRGVHTGAEVAA